MAIEFSNLLKGQLTQSLVKTLFERAGYRVIRLGVEEVFTEIRHLDAEQYQSLCLPENLRFLPDFLVAEPDLEKVVLLEVKFRRTFDSRSARSLFVSLSMQRQYWSDSFALLTIAQPFVQGGRFHQDYIRIITPELTEVLNESYLATSVSPESRKLPCAVFKHAYQTFGWPGVWDSLPTLNNAFERFRAAGDTKVNQAHADFITRSLKSLAEL